jgi:hypothetical protein
MEKNKNKSREPFPPENTPQPPQVMDTSKPPEGSKEKQQPKASAEESGRQKQNEKKEEGKEKLLGESPIEIDDETTI